MTPEDATATAERWAKQLQTLLQAALEIGKPTKIILSVKPGDDLQIDISRKLSIK